ncbi:MAG: DUF1049 domain-containing protein [Alphaproteobacteria bacterium]|nr:DUF1049 domain-containing protein [Alphaproteobacteria bacterium]
MRFLYVLFLLFVLALVLSFALPNRQDVAVGLWPSQTIWQVPLYLVGLAPLGLGLVAGGLMGWIGSVPHRFKARRLGKELEAMQRAAASQQRPQKKSFWSREA